MGDSLLRRVVFRMPLLDLAHQSPHSAGDVLSYTELRELTKLPDEDLTRCLASLTLSKYKLLVKVGLPALCSRAPPLPGPRDGPCTISCPAWQHRH